jgi:hypothetical protein
LITGIRPVLKRTRIMYTSTLAWVGSHSLATAGIVGTISVLIAWFRLPAPVRDTLWAEDGRNFLQAALDQGPVNSLFIPYAGYLHTIPRIVASFTVQVVPVQFYALAMTAAACAIAGVVAAVVYVCSADVVRWVPARLVISFLTVLAPLAPLEVSGNQANVHSLLFWGLWWVLLYRPRTRWGAYVLAGYALLTGLTEIQALFLLPLLLWHLRDRTRWWPRFGYLAGICAQVCVTLLWPRSPSTSPPVDPASIVYGFFINCVVPLWIPQKSIGPAMVWGGILLGLALCLPFVAAFALCIWRGSTLQRVAALGLLGGAVVVYCAGVLENPRSSYDYMALTTHALNSLWLSRYGVVPSMMLCALIPLAAGIVIERSRAAGRQRHPVRHVSARLGVGVLLALLLVQFMPQTTVRSDGPRWRPQLAALSESCEQLPDTAYRQVQETIGWHVNVPCALLR